MKKFLRILTGVGILAVGVAISVLLVITKPEIRQENAMRPAQVVEVMPVSLGNLRAELPSQGLVNARRRTEVAAEVGGRVVEVSPKLEAGLAFDEGEVLVRIDDADYLATLAQAEATLADARLALETEQARSDQARKDWEALGRKGQPSSLTLREPHLASARAAIAAAEKAVEKARRDVERTRVKAPFPGTLARVDTELGAYLSPGAPVAEIFTSAPWEIRLPLALDDWKLLERDPEGGVTGEVAFFTRLGDEETSTGGRIVRSEGEVERDSRSIYVVAEIPGQAEGDWLQPGLFLNAAISGREMEEVALIPFRAFVGREEVGVVDLETNQISKRRVEIERRTGNLVVVSSGLAEGEWVSLTPLADLVEGMEVEPRKVKAPEEVELKPTLSTTKP